MAIGLLKKLRKLTIATKANRTRPAARDLLKARLATPEPAGSIVKAERVKKVTTAQINTSTDATIAAAARAEGGGVISRLKARRANVQPTLSTKSRIERAQFRTEVRAERAERLRGTPAIDRVRTRAGATNPIPNFTTGPIRPDKKVPTLKRRVKTGRR